VRSPSLTYRIWRLRLPLIRCVSACSMKMCTYGIVCPLYTLMHTVYLYRCTVCFSDVRFLVFVYVCVCVCVCVCVLPVCLSICIFRVYVCVCICQSICVSMCLRECAARACLADDATCICSTHATLGAATPSPAAAALTVTIASLRLA